MNIRVESVANPRFINASGSLIACDVKFSHLGEVVEFAASPDDVEPHGREIFAGCLAGLAGPIAAYVPPPAVVPTTVTMRQARLALLGAGLLDSVEAALAGMAGVEGAAARIEWEYAVTLNRTHALTQGLSAALGITAEQLDALFTQAAAL